MAERGPVLVVDDDDVIRDTVADLLSFEGYAVEKAEHGQEALAVAERVQPALILLDMKMPVMDGWAFARAYRDRPGPHAPIVVFTAAHDAAQRAAQIGASGYVGKPFDFSALLDTVARHVAS